MSAQRIAVLAAVVFSLFTARAFAEEVATSTRSAPIIEVYTMGIGDDIFAHFGHAAICVTDARSPNGRCYNYGTADFSTPVPLTYEFIRGRARFWVSVADRGRMLGWYMREDRSVWRQRLPLSPEAARQVSQALEGSTAEEVKYYRYHHFEDNCTTRIRDLLDRVLGGVLSKGNTEERSGPSFREYARRGFAGYPLLLVAANLVLGRSRDRPTTRWEAMFLPEVFRDEVSARLDAPPELVYARRAPIVPAAEWTGEALLAGLGIFFAAVILAAGYFSRRASSRRRALIFRLAVAPFALLAGILGTLLAALAVFSAFPELRVNEVLLVLVPFDLALFFLSPRRAAIYLRVRAIALLVVALGALVGILVQPLWAALILAGAPVLAALQFVRAQPISAER